VLSELSSDAEEGLTTENALHTVPLRASDWWLIVAVAIPIFIVPELIKYLRGGHHIAASTPPLQPVASRDD
jgi:hypothetical protein